MSPQAAVKQLSDALNSAFIERGPEIRSLLVALVAREHVLLLGDPGTGKSALTNAICAAIEPAVGATDTGSFTVLMTRYTVPEEVFGPVSLTGLERDEYRRVTKGYLPTARVAFLDEIFKANSAILNSLLTVVNERVFDNGGTREKCPLEICVGASNELPEDDSLAALYDRFVLRRWVHPIANRDALRSLLSATAEPRITATLTADDLAALRLDAEAAAIPTDVLDVVLDLRDALAREHGITASDRRWRKCMKLLRAAAVIDGRAVVERRDVLVLADALWRKPEERAAIVSTIAGLCSPDLAAAMKAMDAAVELLGLVGPLDKAAVQDTKDTSGATQRGLAFTNDAFKTLLSEVAKLDQRDPSVSEVADKIRAMQVAVSRATRTRLGL